MQQFGWKPGNVNCMTVDLTAKQPGILPSYESPHHVSTNRGLNSCLFSGLPAEVGITKEDKEVQLHQQSFFQLQTSPNAPSLYANEQLLLSSQRQDRKVTTHETTGKKFFIFDQSGAETRMILSSLSPPVTNPAAVTAKPVLAYEFPGSFHALKSQQACPEVHNLHEDHVIGEGSEYHEDTEEINALLYSDNDDVIDDNGGDDDEVSTGRSPFALENGFDDTDSDDEEVTSSVHPLKRPKLLSMASKPMQKVPHGQCEDESVVDVNTTVGAKRSRRDKIRKKLRIIEKLVPGSKSKDPLVILEEAIDYLKSLKGNANRLHEEDPERSSCRGPRV